MDPPLKGPPVHLLMEVDGGAFFCVWDMVVNGEVMRSGSPNAKKAPPIHLQMEMDRGGVAFGVYQDWELEPRCWPGYQSGLVGAWCGAMD